MIFPSSLYIYLIPHLHEIKNKICHRYASVKFFAYQCVNVYGFFTCTKCVDACPFGAIELGKGVKVSPIKCVGCGACQRVCPNEALVVKELDAITTNACEGLGGDIPCVAYVDEAVLRKVGGEVRVCSRCPRGIDVEAEVARIKKDAPWAVVVVEKPWKDPVRRALLKGPADVEVVAGKRVPPRLKYIKKEICLSIATDRCTYCGICASICPTEAVKTMGSSLLFSHDLCTSCGLCISACPEKALGWGPCESWRVELPRRICPVCGSPYYGFRERCPSCLKTEEEFSRWIFTSSLARTTRGGSPT
jgi:ferredoxin